MPNGMILLHDKAMQDEANARFEAPQEETCAIFPADIAGRT